mmetsp:Transcript_5777/g.7532  ORF Transcript_5777/g.7532 Transcript_5777/m.7532 type:complete len:80 (-) Transcript_5777:415-654(-)
MPFCSRFCALVVFCIGDAIAVCVGDAVVGKVDCVGVGVESVGAELDNGDVGGEIRIGDGTDVRVVSEDDLGDVDVWFGA